MTNYFSKELLSKCKMTEEEFSAPIESLKENTTYVVGTFSKNNTTLMLCYKDGVYFFGTGFGVQGCSDYYFKSLSRAYDYFEELIYK